MRWTVRLRLTLLYGALFVLSGAALVAITYGLLDRQLGAPVRVTPPGAPRLPPGQAGVMTASVPDQLRDQRLGDLRAFLTQSGIALAIMAVVAIALGWLVAGRVLRPLRVITASTRRISARNLHERLGLTGPQDDLTELGDTIDGLLARLEAAFESQQRFVANASHELRTPVAVGRVTLQVALADPDLTLDSLRAACAEAIEVGRAQEQLIEALLTLARSQSGLETREVFALGDVVDDVLAELPAAGVRVETSVLPGKVVGDRRLVHRMVFNLVDNAIRYNVDDGWVRVDMTETAGRVAVLVRNSGPVVAEGDVARLVQPFQRDVRDGDGHGLGLSIVAAVARVHGADWDIRALPHGGLGVSVAFPRSGTV